MTRASWNEIKHRKLRGMTKAERAPSTRRATPKPSSPPRWETVCAKPAKPQG